MISLEILFILSLIIIVFIFYLWYAHIKYVKGIKFILKLKIKANYSGRQLTRILLFYCKITVIDVK